MVRIDRKTVLSVLNIGARLLVICLVVAALVSLVNEVTKTRYAEIQKEEQQTAMAKIFGLTEVSCTDLGDETDKIYGISQDGNFLGYCVQTTTAGFGGDLTMMVGFYSDCSIAGVQILSHSETPGLGAKVNDEGYLSQYGGKSGELTLGEDVDAISGATISSRAVLAGVSAAQETLKMYIISGGDAV